MTAKNLAGADDPFTTVEGNLVGCRRAILLALGTPEDFPGLMAATSTLNEHLVDLLDIIGAEKRAAAGRRLNLLGDMDKQADAALRASGNVRAWNKWYESYKKGLGRPPNPEEFKQVRPEMSVLEERLTRALTLVLNGIQKFRREAPPRTARSARRLEVRIVLPEPDTRDRSA